MSKKNNFLSLFTLTAGALFYLLTLTASDINAQAVRLRANINPTCSSSSGSKLKFADIYGEGNIAVMGSYGCKGVFIFDISDPDNPKQAAHYNPSPQQSFLEAIVIGNRGYFGSGGTSPGASSGGDGVHIVDLTDPYNPVFLGKVTPSNGGGYSNIHEMMVHGNYLIQNSNSLSQFDLKVINISDPAAPVFVRNITPGPTGWVHAMHIRGNRMFTSGWGSGSSTTRAKTEIWDIEDLQNRAPIRLGTITEPTATSAGNSMHSSWTSEDGNFLYSAREISSSTASSPGDIRVYNITNPSEPILVNKVTMSDLGLNAVTPHNPVVMGNKLYVSWYQAGTQVFDITQPANLKHIGQYDTYAATFTDEERVQLYAFDPDEVVCGLNVSTGDVVTGYDGNWAVYPFLGEDKVLLGDMFTGLYIVDVTAANGPKKNVVSDFDGDGKSDLSVINPQTGMWHIEQSSDLTSINRHWGVEGDVLVPGDYDGDGKADYGVWSPSTGIWWVFYSSGGYINLHWGINGDIPVAADFDADGKTDFALWRPSSGTWYVFQSSMGIRVLTWGINGDVPLTGDYDGDGKSDYVIWRPSSGTWYVFKSSSSQSFQMNWGENTDTPLSADLNGDGINELVIWRPSTGNWWSLDLTNYSINNRHFGEAGDMPIPADFDGDGKSDLAVFRPSDNNWYQLNSSDGSYVVRNFGQAGNYPHPAASQSY